MQYMKKVNTFGSWFFFTVGLSLVHVWVGILFNELNGWGYDLSEKLRYGALIFFANALAVRVLKDGWNERDFMWSNRHMMSMRSGFSFGFAGPLIVIILSIATYTSLLANKTPGNEFIWVQLGTTLLALVSSLIQAVINDHRFEVIMRALKNQALEDLEIDK